MPTIDPSRLIALQSDAHNVRNICILAHVDHGKTSLTDSLIATNGIISAKLAGKIRYLDSRPDEQTRGITMESSAISLHFSMSRRKVEGETRQEDYLINLIDSPGHIDFSSEVSTASRLCDAAIVLVDAVEGVCSQTVTVLRQVWMEKLKPLLVINKIDRLVTELKMSPAEAYAHLERVLEGVNAVIGGFYQGERMEEDLQWRERTDEKKERKAAQRSGSIGSNGTDHASVIESEIDLQFEERDDEDLYFAPERNNVIFASAIDGWAFSIGQFASIYEKKLGIKRSILQKILWGDFYLDPKTKKVLAQKHLKGRNLKPVFVQLILETIWTVYGATTGGNNGKGDPVLLDKVTKSLSIDLPTHILRSRDSKAVLQAVFSAWLPLSTALLVSVIEYLPSPPLAQAARLPEMIDESPGAKCVSKDVRNAMVNFEKEDSSPTVAYVSKMVAIPESELPKDRRQRDGQILSPEEAREMARKKRAEIAKAQADASATDGVSGITGGIGGASISGDDKEDTTPEQPEDPEHLIGFARLYSGSLSVGQQVYVLPPKFTPAYPHARPEPKKVVVKALYLLMGRGLEPLQRVPAGVVFGIEGLEGHILKTGTLCSQLEGSVNLAGVTIATQPIVRVALEPVNPTDLNKMIRGLKLLEQSDPCAMYEQLESGEHVILTAGELHLERCLKDLQERFAKCEIQAGEPIVPYRETIIRAEDMEAPKNKDLPRGTALAVTASKTLSIRLRVRPLPPNVTDFLIENGASVRKFYAEKKAQEDNARVDTKTSDQQESANLGDETGRERGTLSISEFRAKLQAGFDEIKEERDVWAKIVSRISAFGPRRVGPNLFIDATGTDTCKRFLVEEHELESQDAKGISKDGVQPPTESAPSHDFSDTISYAFQLATAQGPLCREPTQGMAVFLEEVIYNASSSAELAVDTGRLTGELITSIRSAIGSGFLDWSPRILLAMYSCTIQATPEVLGRVYSVLTRRRGSILSESLLEGTPYFTIEARLPVAESFGFSDEIRKRTSGLAQPMLRFTGFEVLDDVNPFWVPKTEEELEDLGEFGDKENVAKKYVDRVRTRKGLLVKGTRGLGRDAEKQKTLKTN